MDFTWRTSVGPGREPALKSARKSRERGRPGRMRSAPAPPPCVSQARVHPGAKCGDEGASVFAVRSAEPSFQNALAGHPEAHRKKNSCGSGVGSGRIRIISFVDAHAVAQGRHPISNASTPWCSRCESALSRSNSQGTTLPSLVTFTRRRPLQSR